MMSLLLHVTNILLLGNNGTIVSELPQTYLLGITATTNKHVGFFAILWVCFGHYSFFPSQGHISYRDLYIYYKLILADVLSNCLEWFNSRTKMKPLCISLIFFTVWFCSGADTNHNTTIKAFAASLCVRPPVEYVSHAPQFHLQCLFVDGGHTSLIDSVFRHRPAHVLSSYSWRLMMKLEWNINISKWIKGFVLKN